MAPDPNPHEDPMLRITRTSLLAASLLGLCVGTAGAQGRHHGAGMNATLAANPSVGGAAMLPTRDIVDNAAASPDHTTLVAAVSAAGLVPVLKGAGPFTVFAPTNAAFAQLPAGTVETLLKPANKGALTSVLTYHVVAGKVDAASLVAAIRRGNGSATLTTVNGQTLTAEMNGARNVVLRDAKGNRIPISTYDVVQSNGIIHVVEKVLLPN
jgi:uncharacterized surface protein with fasciclin (FAS1) repeats